jgi:hypothetical protein
MSFSQSVKGAGKVVDRLVDKVEPATSAAADAAQSALGNVPMKWKRRILGAGAVAGVCSINPMIIPILGCLTVAQWALNGEIKDQLTKNN